MTQRAETQRSNATGLRTAVRPTLVSDMRLDIYSSNETLFMLVELSDAMRRGVRHYRADGTLLPRVNSVVEALIFDGEVFYDEGSSTEPAGH